jgi:hypothetical protein
MLYNVLRTVLENALKEISIPLESLLVGDKKSCINLWQVIVLYLLVLCSLLCQDLALDDLEYFAGKFFINEC